MLMRIMKQYIQNLQQQQKTVLYLKVQPIYEN